MVVVRDPPHVLVRPAGQQRVARLGEGGALAAARDLGHRRGRDRLLPVHAAAVAHGLAEARQVAQRGVEPAAAGFGAHAVDHEVRILLGTDALPDLLAQQFGQGLVAGAAQDPRQHLGVDRLVGEGIAMRAVLLQGLEEVVEGLRARVVGALRQHAPGAGVVPDLGLGIGIVLRVLHADGHVHHLAHRGVAIGGAGHLGQVARHGRGGVELAFGHEDGRQRADEGLGDRHREVRPLRRQRAGIAFEHHLPAVQHEDAVGVGACEHLLEVQVLAAADRLEAHLPGIDRRGGRGQGLRGAGAAPHVGGGHQLADVREGPARARVHVAARVVEGDEPVRRRREALHPAQCLDRGGGRVGQRRRRGAGGLGGGGVHESGAERGHCGGHKTGGGHGSDS